MQHKFLHECILTLDELKSKIKEKEDEIKNFKLCFNSVKELLDSKVELRYMEEELNELIKKLKGANLCMNQIL